MKTILYFSGTGNSKYIASSIADGIDSRCYSIENKKVGFKQIIADSNNLIFIYPIHGSMPPPIMQDFTTRYKDIIFSKKIAIIAVQAMFSGDGARSITDFLNSNNDYYYSKHITAPFNISNFNCNIPGLKIKDITKMDKAQTKMDKQIDSVIEDLNNDVHKLVGFNRFSKLLGMTQNTSFPKVISNAANNFDVNHEQCIICNKCVRHCPVENIINSDGKIIGTGNCISCYRCINECPTNAISVFFKKHKKPRIQYSAPRYRKRNKLCA